VDDAADEESRIFFGVPNVLRGFLFKKLDKFRGVYCSMLARLNKKEGGAAGGGGARASGEGIKRASLPARGACRSAPDAKSERSQKTKQKTDHRDGGIGPHSSGWALANHAPETSMGNDRITS